MARHYFSSFHVLHWKQLSAVPVGGARAGGGQIFLVRGCVVTGAWAGEGGGEGGRVTGPRAAVKVLVEGGRRKGGSLFVNDADARSEKAARLAEIERRIRAWCLVLR